MAAQVEVGVAPAVEVTCAAQALTGAFCAGAFAHVVDEQDCQMELTLEFAQVTEQRSDFFGGVFIAAVKPYEGVEDQQRGLECGDGLAQTLAILWQVEQEARGGDYVEGERIEGGVGGRADAFEALADGGQGVLGGKQEHRAAAPDGEVAQARGGGGDTDGDVEGQEAFAALGFAAEDADGLIGPKRFDEPLGLLGRID